MEETGSEKEGCEMYSLVEIVEEVCIKNGMGE